MSKHINKLSFTFKWCPTIKLGGVPHNGGSVLSNRYAFDVLRGVGHI